MDKEQQIRLNFLNETEQFFTQMESNFLGLADTEINRQQLDLVLRSAHSIKGGAAMMGFNILSQVAHRLEDFLKILRVRYTSSLVNVEVETLLLQSVDCLRQISKLNRQGLAARESKSNKSNISNSLLLREILRQRDRTQTIFEQLEQNLGELKDTDEDILMAQDEDIDPALLIFEEGVEKILDHFEHQSKTLAIEEIAEKLATTAQELIAFGKMANLEPFIQLCQSIQQQAITLSSAEIKPLADLALKTWRRSHALVLRGSMEKLPSCLENNNLVESSHTTTVEPETREILPDDLLDADYDPLEDDSLELDGLQSAFDINLTQSDRLEWIEANHQLETNFDEVKEVAEAFIPQSLNPLEDDSLDLSELESVFDIDTTEATPSTIQLTQDEFSPSLYPQQELSVDKMVRVPVAQLKQFNNLFEQLILDRNTINLRLQQFQKVISLMRVRMSQIERSNTQLKQWYDHASGEGFFNKQQLLKNLVTPSTRSDLALQGGKANRNLVVDRALRDRFDTLEMDRYDEVHVICQDQMETVVQLQEVTKDIELGLQELNQAVSELNYTTKSMQGNVTRTQMLPFAEVVKRFPRAIRDLNLQFNKQVNLEVFGDDTLLDRSVIEALGDPLMHLLRNAFDHGIESPENRIAAGKNPSGTITIQATNQGTYNVITLADDGSGISLDQIRDRVCRMGIPRRFVEKIPEQELLDFIFEPGFTTTQEVTELSGRGVGMDVVRTNLQEIRGDVQVTTNPGQGTKFTLRIPFTLSILRVAIIEQAGMIFAVPANSIQELIPLESETIKTLENNKYILWNQTEIPLVEMEKTLVYPRSHHTTNLTSNPVIDQTMALLVGEQKIFAALQISRFWHEQESTIRPIDSPIPLPPGVISSLVLGDGKVIPLVDPVLLIEKCLKEQSANEQKSDDFTETPNIPAIKTILLVDDSINVRLYLSLTLEKAGYRVEQAKDGQEAIDKLVSGLSVQAIICDIEMPRVDGYGVLEEIKQRAEFAELPIVMLTSRSNEKHRKLAMNLGASAYFSKPYNEQQLLDKLGKLLQTKS